jgi:hypothetical protein
LDRSAKDVFFLSRAAGVIIVRIHIVLLSAIQR